MNYKKEWLIESQERYEAYLKGEIEAFDYKDSFLQTMQLIDEIQKNSVKSASRTH